MSAGVAAQLSESKLLVPIQVLQEKKLLGVARGGGSGFRFRV